MEYVGRCNIVTSRADFEPQDSCDQVVKRFHVGLKKTPKQLAF